MATSVAKRMDYPIKDMDGVFPETKIAGSNLRPVKNVVDAKPDAKGLAVIVPNGNYWKTSGKHSLTQFTENDGRAMEQSFKGFDFNCYLVPDLTGDQIQEIVGQITNCTYPDSYKYVAFIYSGHGNISVDQKRSGLVGIDGKLIDTTHIIDSLKKIKPQSMVKMLFLDACRGDQDPPPVPKGGQGSTNCLVAYATQLGHQAFGIRYEGSQWMILLAEKLEKLRDRSVQEVLKLVRKELLERPNDYKAQYPEMDDSDCSQLIYLARDPVEVKGSVPRFDKEPNIGDLASFARRDRDGLVRIIDRILEADMSVIHILNRWLLNSEDRLKKPDQPSDEQKLRFVLDVLNKWLSTDNPKLQRTWNSLTECLGDAELDASVVQDIRDNLDLNVHT